MIAKHMRLAPMHGLIAGLLLVSGAFAGAQQQALASPIPGRVEVRGHLRITLGPVRQIMRGARTPLVTRHADGRIIVASSQVILSSNNGDTWRPVAYPQTQLNTIGLRDGTTFLLGFDPKPKEETPGAFGTQYWLSKDHGLNVEGPYEGMLRVPPELCATKEPHWFHGNLVEQGDGALLSVVQMREGTEQRSWRVYLVRSLDRGKNWDYVAPIASKETIQDPAGLLAGTPWPLYYAVEPCLVDLGGGRLVCVMRSVNDERAKLPESLTGPPQEEYHDLFGAVAGDGIHESLMKLPADRFYAPGPRSAPLIIAYSDDNGATWRDQQPMTEARGCFPRLATDGSLLALSYGGLSGVPRWGNAITFSTDVGLSWSEEIVFAPFLTTGYTGIVSTAPGRFLAFFDCTPPQPWTNQPAWWIGALDISVEVLPPPGATTVVQ